MKFYQKSHELKEFERMTISDAESKKYNSSWYHGRPFSVVCACAADSDRLISLLSKYCLHYDYKGITSAVNGKHIYIIFEDWQNVHDGDPQ